MEVKCSRCGVVLPMTTGEYYKLFYMYRNEGSVMKVGTTYRLCKKCGEMRLRYFK